MNLLLQPPDGVSKIHLDGEMNLGGGDSEEYLNFGGRRWRWKWRRRRRRRWVFLKVVGGRRIFDVDERRRHLGGWVWRDNHLNAAVVEHLDGGDVTIVLEKVAIEEEGLSGSGYAMVFLNLLFDLKNSIEETQFNAERFPSLRFKDDIHGRENVKTEMVGELEDWYCFKTSVSITNMKYPPQLSPDLHA